MARLLSAMGRGDREAAATFLERYGGHIRRRMRGKIKSGMRRLCDSQDILSTLSRRLDQYVGAGRLEARTVAEFWSLIYTIADRSVAEKSIIFDSLCDKELGVARSRVDAHGVIDLSAESEFELLLRRIPLESDRQIARMWALGKSSEVIGFEMKMTPSDVRQRWRRVRVRLREELVGSDA